MAPRKTIADLEQEIEAEKAKSAELQEQIYNAPVASDIKTGDEIALVEENRELKEALAKNKSHTEASESRLMSYLSQIEESGGETGGCVTYTPDEYREASAANGRIMGREKGVVTKCSIEELRALINSDWAPSMVMEKHGMNAEGLQQLVWKLSLSELRDKPIKLNFRRDTFGREG